MKMKFKWLRPVEKIKFDRSGGDRGRLFLANEAKRLMDPYVPFRMGMLSQNVRTYVESGEGYVKYNSPYAHYQYEGILYVSSRTGSAWAKNGEYKVPAKPEKELEHNKARHPLATSYWDKAMMTARGTDLVAAYNRWLRGKS